MADQHQPIAPNQEPLEGEVIQTVETDDDGTIDRHAVEIVEGPDHHA